MAAGLTILLPLVIICFLLANYCLSFRSFIPEATVFTALLQKRKPATFLQTDERWKLGTYDKKQKLFTTICYVCLSVCKTFIASIIMIMFLLTYFNSDLHFKVLFLWTTGHFTGHHHLFHKILSFFLLLNHICITFLRKIFQICST